MSHAPRPPRHAWPVLALITAVGIVGCNDSPTIAAHGTTPSPRPTPSRPVWAPCRPPWNGGSRSSWRHG
jgi:hypothetical protein